MKEFHPGAVVPDCDGGSTIEASEEIVRERWHEELEHDGPKEVAPELGARVSGRMINTPDR